MASFNRVSRPSKPGQNVFLFTLIALAFAAVLCFSNTGIAQDLSSHHEAMKLHPKVESTLGRLEKEHERGRLFSERFARERKVKIEADDKVTVFVLPEKGKRIDAGALRALGVEIIKATRDVIKASVPIALLSTLADTTEEIAFIKLPDKPIPLLTASEGVGLTQVPFYYSGGNTGQGVKVAVIDVGFAGVSSSISRGDLPANVTLVDCTGTSCVPTTFPSETEKHGTGVAEIIYDMAPGTQLFLIKMDDPSDLVDAKNYCISNGIRVINHSVGWFNTNFYDGACYYDFLPVCTANDANAHGILWVNAAGNAARRHYAAPFTDANADALLLSHRITSFTPFPAGLLSTPHVAGAAALILSKNPGYSVSELWTAVTRSAIDLGAAGPDNVYGYGRLSVPSTFLDVSFEYWAHDYVARLYGSGITGGCSTAPLLFCPDEGITRGQMAVFMETSLGRTPSASCTGMFSDVNAATVGDTVCSFIEQFAAEGITGGCGNGKFCPNDPVTRGQMAVFIEAALGAAPAAPCSGTFTDVSAGTTGDLFCRYIEDFATKGITSGCGTGVFCPNNPVTRSQMAVFLVAAPTPLAP